MLRISGLGCPPSWDAALSSPLAVENPALREALIWFRARLGESWKGWAKTYPLAERFFTGFQGGAPEGVRLYRDLERLADVPNLDTVVLAGLGSSEWTQFTAAEMALTFCAPFQAAGRRVEFIKNDHERCPDAQIEIAGRPVIVEFKGMHLTSELDEWQRFAAHVSQELTSHRLDLNCFHIHFTEGALGHKDEIVAALVALHGSGDGGWHELPHQGGEVELNPSRDRPRFQYPATQKHDLDRVVLKLKGWCTQLEGLSSPTLLVVRTDHFFAVFDPARNFEQATAVTARLADALATKQMISGIVIYDEPFMPALPSVVQLTDHYRMLVGTSSRAFPRYVLLVPNPAARIPLQTAELDAIGGPKMVW